jgi:uncharacterized protein (DUF58 family)
MLICGFCLHSLFSISLFLMFVVALFVLFIIDFTFENETSRYLISRKGQSLLGPEKTHLADEIIVRLNINFLHLGPSLTEY